jgi:signal transduction histidine kinase
VADSTPGDGPDPTSGSIGSEQTRAAVGGSVDDQTLADREQTLTEADQTRSDADQTSADVDQSLADSDQTAADRDQAASDRDFVHGGDSAVHDLTRDLRGRSAKERRRNAAGRFESAAARDGAARVRDGVALARDEAAALRDRETAARDIADRGPGRGGIARQDVAVRARADRARAAGDRDAAAIARAQAAADREQAASDREQAARDREQAQATIDALAAIIDTSRAIDGRTGLIRFLETVAERGRALVRARSLIVMLQVDGSLDVAAAAGEVPEGLVGQRLPLEDPILGVALRTGHTQRLAHRSNEAERSERDVAQFGFHAERGLIVPLVSRRESVGVLLALDRLDGAADFSAQDERLLEAFATSAATAVVTAEAASAQRRQRLAAAERDRARWAQELHDETLQGLAALRLGLSAASRAESRDALEEVLHAIVGQLETEVSGLRAVIADLRPPTLDQFGAEAAIEALAERARSDGLNVHVRVDLGPETGREDHRPSSETEIAIYRIVQEALANALESGHATRVVIEVIEGEAAIDVMVRDDGAGFDTADRTVGLGVLGMRERAELLNGTLEIESSPDRGTIVRATLPPLRQVGINRHTR